jgi:hypothetical protein
MILVVKIKDSDNINNIIGVKEDISSRLEAICDVERIDVYANEQFEQKG